MRKHGPMYLQIAESLHKEIVSGAHALGDFLPSERILCSRYGVTRITIRGAVEHLEKQGLVRREAGRGTKVVAIPTESNRIEVVFFKWISPFADPLYADFFSGVAHQVSQSGHQLTLSYISDAHAVRQHMERLRTPIAKGIIVAGAWEWYKPVIGAIEMRYPTVLVGTPHGSLRADVLEPDYEGAVALAVDHALRLGFRNLLLVGGFFSQEEGRDERTTAAFRHVANERGLPPENTFVWSRKDQTPPSSEKHDPGAFPIPSDLYNHYPTPLAVLAISPTPACLCADLARERGLRIPQDVAVISLQDSAALAARSPALSAVRLYGRDVGVLAVEHLRSRLQNPTLPRRLQRAPVEMAVRGSCGAASSAPQSAPSHPSDAAPLSLLPFTGSSLSRME
jgi:DNA-binding LacI/PurR family transcriptional regulator